MNGKFVGFVLLVSLGNFSIALAQIDVQTKEAIIAVLLSKSVSDKIFVDYPEGTWVGAFSPKGGRYAFIVPNRTLQSVYPTILNEMPFTTSTDGLLNMRKLYSDSVQSIFITQEVPGKLITVLEQIQVDSDTAHIELITTSYRDKKDYKDKYIRVYSKLIRANDQWTITELNVDQILWTDYFK